jgi:hypothetical protein
MAKAKRRNGSFPGGRRQGIQGQGQPRGQIRHQQNHVPGNFNPVFGGNLCLAAEIEKPGYEDLWEMFALNDKVRPFPGKGCASEWIPPGQDGHVVLISGQERHDILPAGQTGTAPPGAFGSVSAFG